MHSILLDRPTLLGFARWLRGVPRRWQSRLESFQSSECCRLRLYSWLSYQDQWSVDLGPATALPAQAGVGDSLHLRLAECYLEVEVSPFLLDLLSAGASLHDMDSAMRHPDRLVMLHQQQGKPAWQSQASLMSLRHDLFFDCVASAFCHVP